MIIYCWEKMFLIGLIQTQVILEQETMFLFSPITFPLYVFILIEMGLKGGKSNKNAERGRDHGEGQPLVSSSRGALLT